MRGGSSVGYRTSIEIDTDAVLIKRNVYKIGANLISGDADKEKLLRYPVIHTGGLTFCDLSKVQHLSIHRIYILYPALLRLNALDIVR